MSGGLLHEDCPHASMTGVDQTQGDDKVWRCDCCTALLRIERVGDGTVRTVPATQETSS